MQKLYTPRLAFRIGYNAIIQRGISNVLNTKTNVIEHEHRDHTLICPRWEEAIIREHRTSDVPFDLMQKETIDMIHNRDNPNKQQQAYLASITESSY